MTAYAFNHATLYALSICQTQNSHFRIAFCRGLPVRAVQRCLVGFTGSPLPHVRGEVRRLIAKGIPGPVNV